MATAAQLARIEDDNNAIQVGWAEGEGASEFTTWMDQYVIDDDAAFRLLGLDAAPKPFRWYGDVRTSDAVSEYGSGSESCRWWDLEDGRVLGIPSSSDPWLVPASAEPPLVTVTRVIEGYADDRQPDDEDEG